MENKKKQLVKTTNSKCKGSLFPVTDWSFVEQAANSDFSVSEFAQNTLLVEYLPAIRNYLIRVRRIPSGDVDDIIQGFIALKVLRGRMFKKADRTKGKFRNLVLKSLSNYLSTWYTAHARDLLVGAGRDTLPDIAVRSDQEVLFDIEWAFQTVRTALSAMKDECAMKSRMDIWYVFYLRIASPALEGCEEVSYGELMARLNLSSPRDAINLLVTARRMFIRCLRHVIGRYLEDGVSIDSELADLKKILQNVRNTNPFYEVLQM